MYPHALVQVHPIFVLSIADLLLSVLWLLGGGAWLGGFKQRNWCYALSLFTVVSVPYHFPIDGNVIID